MRLDVDVAVVGAGPAGSAAATTLASRGVRVALLDRACFPRAKACGDGLTPRALAALDRLGVWEDIEAHACIVESLRTMNLRTAAAWIGPIPSRLGTCDRGAVVRRDLLDDILRQRAMHMGATFEGGVSIEHVDQVDADHCILGGLSEGRRWQCASRFVIIADGAGGRVGDRLRRSTQSLLSGVAVRQYWRVSSVPSTLTICVPLESCEGVYAGYGWIFPVSGEVANVGVGLYGVQNGRELRRVYSGFMARLCQIDQAWTKAVPYGAAQGGLLRSGGQLSDLVRGRIVLAGDAAAVTNPFTGEGIAQALDSGEIAALAVLDECESPGQLLRSLVSRMHEAFPESTRVAEHLPWLVARAGRFVSEFWGAVSPPLGMIGRAARRVALEEHRGLAAQRANEKVARTWSHVRTAIASEFPLLMQLLDAFRDESEAVLDRPLQMFWEEHGRGPVQRPREVDDIAQLLCLGSLMCVISGEAAVEDGISTPAVDREAASWAVNAVALGAADILMARCFALASRMSSSVSVACGKALSCAFAGLSGRAANGAESTAPIDRVLHDLARDFKSAARTCVARAA